MQHSRSVAGHLLVLYLTIAYFIFIRCYQLLYTSLRPLTGAVGVSMESLCQPSLSSAVTNRAARIRLGHSFIIII